MRSEAPRVVMLLSNGYRPDWRVQKEAHTLALAGYRVTVIAWDRERDYPQHTVETIPALLDRALHDWPGRGAADPLPVSIVRVQAAAGYRTGRRLLRTMPHFYRLAWHELRRARPDVVHANDLDTLPLAWGYRRVTGVPVIYDAREYYPGMVRANVGGTISRALDRLDGWLTPRADAVLTVGERLAERLTALGGRVWVVHNSQPLPDRAALEAAGRAQRRALGVPENDLLVVYVGFLNPDRLLAPILAAVRETPSCWLVVGGTGPQMAQVRAAAADCARIRVMGWVPVDAVLPLVAAGDVVYYGLDMRVPNSFYFMPNLAFFALAAGRPLLVTPGPEIATVVEQAGCGVVLEAATASAARAALHRLEDANFRATLAQQARYIHQERFNWAFAASQLVETYRHVLGGG